MRLSSLLGCALAGCGGARFAIDGPDAFMNGAIDGRTPRRLHHLIETHPDVTRIVLQQVPGSKNDHANVEAARALRAAGLSTHVPADGEIASGGVDFFCAGVERTAEDGARFGVHSWAGDGIVPTELPEDSPEHDLYLDFYTEMGIPTSFYWFTLQAAPAEDIDWMTPDELDAYGLLTR